MTWDVCEAAPTLLGPAGVILGSAGGGEGLGAGYWFSFCQLAVQGMDAPCRSCQGAPVLLSAGSVQGGLSKLGLAQVICAVQISAPLGLGSAAPGEDVPSLAVAAAPQEQCRAGGSGQGCSSRSLAQLCSVGAPQGSGMGRVGRLGPGRAGPGREPRSGVSEPRPSARQRITRPSSAVQDFDSLLLVLITQECLVCGHCFAF